ncbi:MAG: IS66 family transposase [Saprospiraceae bacterium]
MSLEEEILTLKTLVSSLLERVSQLEAENAQLRLENIALKNENLELKARLAKNSTNSHKPPSSEGYSKKPAFPKVTTNKVGGQVGHKGQTLQMSPRPDELVKHYAQICSSCLNKLSESDVIKVGSSHQVFDLPPQKLWVVQHELLVSQCSCGCQNKASLPLGLSASPVQYGSNIKALAVYLNTDFKLPFQKISTLFGDLYGYEFNPSTAFSANEQAYQKLEPIEIQIKQALTEAKVVHADETGVRCQGSLQWLHVACNALYSYFFIHAKRGKLAIESEKSILQDCKNYIMHDCWTSYFGLDQATHLICNAHIVRELQALIETGSIWASLMQKYLLNLYDISNQQVLAQEFLPKYVQEFHQICQQGFLEEPPPLKTIGKKGRTKKSKGRNLLERLSENQDAVLSFAFHNDLPFTNNQAERDLRPVKTKQKVSACFRTIAGANHYARIQGFISTVRKQGLNPFQQLQSVFQNQFSWKTH